MREDEKFVEFVSSSLCMWKAQFRRTNKTGKLKKKNKNKNKNKKKKQNKTKQNKTETYFSN